MYAGALLLSASTVKYILFFPMAAARSSGADDGSITVFYGRHKDKTLPEGKNTIDLQTGGSDLEFTPAGDGFRIRRL